jgi:hypothetical protein
MKRLSFAICAAALMLPLASIADTIVITDDFESYADNAALEAVWTASGVGAVPLQTTVAGGANGSDKFVRLPAAGTVFLRRALGGNFNPTTGTTLNVTVYMKAANWGGTRAAAGVRDVAGGVPIMHIGSHNGTASNTTPPDQPINDRFAYRLVSFTGFPSSSSNWVSIIAGPTRAANTWHRLQLACAGGSVVPYVNNVAYTANTTTFTGIPSAPFTGAQIGYGSPANLDVDVDHITISTGAFNSDVSDWNLY